MTRFVVYTILLLCLTQLQGMESHIPLTVKTFKHNECYMLPARFTVFEIKQILYKKLSIKPEHQRLYVTVAAEATDNKPYMGCMHTLCPEMTVQEIIDTYKSSIIEMYVPWSIFKNIIDIR